MKSEDGGTAFPHVNPVTAQTYNAGMTLRDWFAGQALQGLFAWSVERGIGNMLDPGDARAVDSLFAQAAYRIADAMLSQRKEN